MEDNCIWEINGLKLSLDMEDAETAEKYIASLDILKEADVLRINKDISYSEMIHTYCRIFRKFYNNLFGDGISEKIFVGIKDNIRKYDAVYESLIDFVYKQRIESASRMNQIVKRYAPKKAKK